MSRGLTALLVVGASGYLVVAKLLTRGETGMGMSLNLVLSVGVLVAAGMLTALQRKWLVGSTAAIFRTLAVLGASRAKDQDCCSGR